MTFWAWAFAAVGSEGELDLARAQVALESEQYATARDLAQGVLQVEPDNLVAHQLYLRASRDGNWLSVAEEAYLNQEGSIFPLMHALHVAEARGEGPARVPDDITFLPSEAAAWVRATDAMSRHQPADAIATLDGVETPLTSVVRLEALRATGDTRALAAAAHTLIDEWPDRPDLLLPVLQIEDAPVQRLARRVHRRIEREWRTAGTLQAYRYRLFSIGVGDYELSRAIGDRLVELGEPQPLYRPQRSATTRNATATILAKRGRAQVLPGPPSEMEAFVRYLSALFIENGQSALLPELWAALRAQADSAENALQHGICLAAEEDWSSALEASTETIVHASRGARTDPGRLRFSEQRGQLSAAWGLRAEAEDALGQQREALRSALIARLLEPAPQWQALYARIAARSASTGVVAPDPAQRQVLAAVFEQVAQMSAAGEREAAHATAMEALLIGAQLARDGEPLLDGRQVARLLDALSGTGESEAELAWATTALWIAPAPHRFARRAAILEALGDWEAAFVAWALAMERDGAVRTWHGQGPPESAMKAVIDLFAVARESATKPQLLAAGTDGANEAPRVGRIVPSWRVAGTDGEIGDASLRGNVVLLTFWASWCGPCLQELPVLDGLARRLVEEGLPVRMVAVSIDERRESWRQASARLRLQTVTNVWSPEMKGPFRVRSLPQSFLIGPEGTIVGSFTGFDRGDEHALETEIRGQLQ